MLDPQLRQERLELALELSSIVGADGNDLDACGDDVYRNEFAKLFAASVLCLRKRMNFKQVKSSTHSIAYRLPPREVT